MRGSTAIGDPRHPAAGVNPVFAETAPIGDTLASAPALRFLFWCFATGGFRSAPSASIARPFESFPDRRGSKHVP